MRFSVPAITWLRAYRRDSLRHDLAAGITLAAYLLPAGLGDVLVQLHERFQFVVFDCAPVNVYTDALILGPRVDATVFVIEADRTRVDEVQRAKRQLERSGAKLLGVLLNRRKTYLPRFLEEIV